ncbi:MAG TPA: hypothetical protein VI959_03020 [Alphaproteobacteria bacterium]|nr:hypothetical protein [Alphaproteobacteria bacterium]
MLLRLRQTSKDFVQILPHSKKPLTFSWSLVALLSYCVFFLVWTFFNFMPVVKSFYSTSSTRILEIYTPSNQDNHLMSILGYLQQDLTVEKVEVLPVQELESLIPYWVSFDDPFFTTPNYVRLSLKDMFDEQKTLENLRQFTASVRLLKEIPWQSKIVHLIIFAFSALFFLSFICLFEIKRTGENMGRLTTSFLQEELFVHSLFGTPVKKLFSKIFKNQRTFFVKRSLVMVLVGFIGFYLTLYAVFDINQLDVTLLLKTIGVFILSFFLYFYFVRWFYKKGFTKEYAIIAKS